MQLKNAFRGWLNNRWARLVPGVITVLFVLPMPALAFQFLSNNWFTTVDKGNAAPTPTYQFNSAGTNGGLLSVDMGSLNNASMDHSYFTLTNTVAISNPVRDIVSLQEDFSGIFYNMRFFTVDVSFVPNNPDPSGVTTKTRTMTSLRQFNVNPSGPGSIHASQSKKFAFYNNTHGNLTYTVKVEVNFAKYNPGSWNSSTISFNFTQL